MKDAICNGSTYCWPTTMSSLTGLGTKELGILFRNKFDSYRCIKRVYRHDGLDFLESFGIKYGLCMIGDDLRVGRWAEKIQDPHNTYMIFIRQHVFLFRDGKVCCTSTKGKVVKWDHTFRYNMARLECVLKIRGEFQMGRAKKHVEMLKGEKKTIQSAKRTCLKLAATHGLSVDDRDLPDGHIWCYFPEELIASKFDGEDPFDDAHCFCDWDELLSGLREVFRD